MHYANKVSDYLGNRKYLYITLSLLGKVIEQRIYGVITVKDNNCHASIESFPGVAFG